MIDFSKPISQNSNFTGAHSELLVNYDIEDENRNYEYDNLVFAYLASGMKQINITAFPVIDLKPEMVIMGASKVVADISLPTTTLEDPTLCFSLEISKERAWKVLEKINEQYSLPDLIKEEQKLEGAKVYFGSGGQMVTNALQTIQKLLVEDALFKDYWIDLKIEELVLCCLQTNMRETLMIGFNENRIVDHPLSFAIKYIKNNLYKKIDIKTLSNKACMSKSTFFRQFKFHFGMTPIAYIHSERIREAQKLLKNSDKSISEIGYKLGYNSPSYFALQFEKIVGNSPNAFRKSDIEE